jgi:hypothetical protein
MGAPCKAPPSAPAAEWAELIISYGYLWERLSSRDCKNVPQKIKSARFRRALFILLKLS